MGRSIRIERIDNGYIVRATDPKIASENDKPGPRNWRDPDREYTFKTCKEACDFIERIAEKAMPIDPAPPDPFASAFDAAIKADAADDNDGDE